MNFETVPTVVDEIIKRASHPLYGITITPPDYYQAIINWQKDRNGVSLEEKNIGYEKWSFRRPFVSFKGFSN